MYSSAVLEKLHPSPEPASEPLLLDLDNKAPDAIFLMQAGLVLLHPFYSALFNKLDLLTPDNTFKHEEHLWQALAILHFVATGQTEAQAEYALVLPKLLCGVPVNLPIPLGTRLSARAQEETEHMMQAAIAHWEALGSVSPDGLREGFLQRPGKLSKRDSGWLLQVETNTIDFLLDRLPWNLSVVKLPWMKEFLRVEWR